MTDDDLAMAFREGLQRHADVVDVSAPVADRARTAARRRRQGRATVAVAAACVAAVGIAGFVVAGGGSGDSDDPRVADQSSETVTEVTQWRTEYWHGLRVDVPAAWGWGTAPVGQGASGPYLCGGPGAMVLGSGRRLVNPDPSEPYIGRPLMLSDLCIGGDSLLNPSAPYVWLDAAVDVGTVDVGNGYEQQTVDVAGTKLTVATDDPTLRRQIIGSAGAGGLCPANVKLPMDGRSETTIEGVGDLQEARVCAYDDETSELVAASPLDLADFVRMEEALNQAPNDPRLCKDAGELVVVTGWYADPYTDDRELWLRHDRVFELACGVVDVGADPLAGSADSQRVRMTTEAVDAWRSGLYEASLYHFIGPQG